MKEWSAEDFLRDALAYIHTDSVLYERIQAYLAKQKESPILSHLDAVINRWQGLHDTVDDFSDDPHADRAEYAELLKYLHAYRSIVANTAMTIPTLEAAMADTTRTVYLIVYDDAERQPELVIGDVRAARRFHDISGAWNAHLFGKIRSNSRDDPRYSDNIAIGVAPSPAPAAPPEHVCGLQGFGALGDECPACTYWREKREGKDGVKEVSRG
jgi:hypothetical protein